MKTKMVFPLTLPTTPSPRRTHHKAIECYTYFVCLVFYCKKIKRKLLNIFESDSCLHIHSPAYIIIECASVSNKKCNTYKFMKHNSQTVNFKFFFLLVSFCFVFLLVYAVLVYIKYSKYNHRNEWSVSVK